MAKPVIVVVDDASASRDAICGLLGNRYPGALFIMIGAEPHTGWLPDPVERDGHGFVATGRDLMGTGRAPGSWPLARPPFESETSIPGRVRDGDVRSGSVKRVAAAVGAGSAVVQYVQKYLSGR
jgi:thioredoxin reductase (NADPH)